MKIFKSNRSGFTLIELLVVIAIISLLSSVVLASLRDARDKAKISKFRQEINQFVIAIELYKNDTGSYPGEGTDCEQHHFANYTDGSGGVAPWLANTNCISETLNGITHTGKEIDITSLLVPKYLSKMPASPTISSNFIFSVGGFNKCYGKTSPVPYIILVNSWIKGFEDWPPYGNYDGVSSSPGYHCWSL